MTQTDIIVLTSGRGSNFRAVHEAILTGRLKNCRIKALLTDRPNTGAQSYAEEQSIPVCIIEYKSFLDRKEFDKKLLEKLIEFKPDLICTLGFMRILRRDLVRHFEGKIINIHPSLLPSFPGMHAQKQALDYGVRVTGATVHFMDEGTDTGPVILQKAVAVPDGAGEEELSAVVLQEEHKLIVEAVDLFCRGSLRIEGRHVRIRI